MKQLLLISPSFPLPLDRGQHIRIFNILLACARDFQITFVGPRPGDSSGAEWIESVCRRVVYVDFLPFAGLTVADFVDTARTLRTIPRPVTVRFSRCYLPALREISLDNFHLIVAISLPVARLVRSRSDRLVVDLDDVSHVKHWRKLTVHGFTPAAVGEVWNVCRFFFKEVVEARRYLATAVCSEEDRSYLERWGLKNVLTIPNGVDAVSPVRDRRIDSGLQQFKLVFVGNMNYSPNRDAVVWFARQVLPIIEESISDVAFDVIGPNATSDLISELHGRVTFRGFIDDLRDVLEHYDVSVAPIRFGGGTKLKVLEAMSMGLPVVTTPVGAEGLGLSSGTHALIAWTPEDFARSVVMLFRDPALAQSISQQARDLIRSRFLWPVIRDRLADWLLTVS